MRSIQRLLDADAAADMVARENSGFSFTTYQAGKLCMVGCKADRRADAPFSMFERNSSSCMGMCASADDCSCG